jgi:hypothetical protein
MTMTDPAISPLDVAQNVETTADNLTPPGAEHDRHGHPYPEDYIRRLRTFLSERFPDEVALTNRQEPEHPVDIAIRLLSAMATHGDVERCNLEYCNKPRAHTDGHGWVHYR